jgi:WD40 repeat protein
MCTCSPRLAILLGVTVWLVLLDTAELRSADDAEPPLPPGAVRRLGDTRLRPGVRVTHLAFSPDGKQLASWGNWLYFEDRLSVWDTATGRELFAQAMPERQVGGICWWPKGNNFAWWSPEGRFTEWALPDVKTRPAPQGEKPVVGPPPLARPPARAAFARATFSPDWSRIAVLRSEAVVPNLVPNLTVDLFDAKPCKSLSELHRIATRGSFPQGNCKGLRLIRGGKAAVVLIETKTKGEQSVVVWDVEPDSLSNPVVIPIAVEQGSRQSFDVAEDGSALAVGMGDGTIRVYELPSCKERLSVKKHDGPKRGGRWSEVSAVKFVNGGRNILSAGRDNSQVVWDARTGTDVARLDGHSSWVESVAVSADGRRVATAGQDSLIRLWDAATWKPILPPHGPRASVWRLEVSRDGKYAAAGSGDGLHVWELASGREVRTLDSSYKSGHVLFEPEGELLLGDDEENLSLCPIGAGQARPIAAKGHMLSFSPDGKTLLTGQGNAVSVWDWPACTKRRSVPLKSEPKSAAFSSDGNTVVLGPGQASIVHLATGKLTELPVKLHWFNNAAGFSADGRQLVGSVGGPKAETWNIATRNQGRFFDQPAQRPPGHFYLLSLAVSPDRRRAVSCHSDGGVTLYEMATGQILAHFTGHREGVIAVSWTPDSNSVLSGGGDHVVYVWDTSVRSLAGNVNKLSPEELPKAWDQLGAQPAREAIKTMAALAVDAESTVSFLEGKLKPTPPVTAAALDRLFKDLDDASFATRARADRELKALGPRAVAGVRERLAKATSAEVKRRAEDFLEQFSKDEPTPDRVRFLRSLEVLALTNSPAARRLLETLANGAAETWQTDTARETLRSMKAATR